MDVHYTRKVNYLYEKPAAQNCTQLLTVIKNGISVKFEISRKKIFKEFAEERSRTSTDLLINIIEST